MLLSRLYIPKIFKSWKISNIKKIHYLGNLHRKYKILGNLFIKSKIPGIFYLEKLP